MAIDHAPQEIRMLKKHMASCLVATALAATSALAQTPPPPSAGTDRPTASGSGSTTTGSPAMQPGAGTAPAGSSATVGAPAGGGSPAPQTAASNAGGSQGQFMTQLQPNQIMASRLIGTTVVGANNESIGDVNDVIIDRNGQAMAVVIGVGGFLGIGEKDVAVPFQQLDFVASPQGNQQTSGTATGAGGAGSGASGGNVSTTGSTATTGSTGSTNAGSNAGDGGVPDRIMLRMTKAELQAAPTFARSNRNQDGGTSAPKQ